MAIGFKDFLNVDYAPGMPDLVKRNAKKRKQDIPTGNTGESVERTDEALSMAQRRAKSRQMKKYKTRLAMGRKKQAAKMADPARLKRRAQKAARAALAKKLTKGIPKSELTSARKAEIEKRLDKMKQRVNRLAKKMLPAVRKKELARRQK